jgi:hypothetical protein
MPNIYLFRTANTDLPYIVGRLELLGCKINHIQTEVRTFEIDVPLEYDLAIPFTIHEWIDTIWIKKLRTASFCVNQPTDSGWESYQKLYLGDSMHLAEAHEITQGSPDITIGFLDSGCWTIHSEFEGRATSMNPIDAREHGTATASCAIAARDGGDIVGVAPFCKSHTISYGNVGDSDVLTGWAGLYSLVNIYNVKIINMSLGAQPSDPDVGLIYEPFIRLDTDKVAINGNMAQAGCAGWSVVFSVSDADVDTSIYGKFVSQPAPPYYDADLDKTICYVHFNEGEKQAIPDNYDYFFSPTNELEDFMDYAWNLDIMMVVSAGNEANGNRAGAWNRFRKVISAGACCNVNPDGGSLLANYSTKGAYVTSMVPGRYVGVDQSWPHDGTNVGTDVYYRCAAAIDHLNIEKWTGQAKMGFRKSYDFTDLPTSIGYITVEGNLTGEDLIGCYLWIESSFYFPGINMAAGLFVTNVEFDGYHRSLIYMNEAGPTCNSTVDGFVVLFRFPTIATVNNYTLAVTNVIPDDSFIGTTLLVRETDIITPLSKVVAVNANTVVIDQPVLKEFSNVEVAFTYGLPKTTDLPGTSFSSPTLAGIMALIKASYPHGASSEVLWNTLHDSSDFLYQSGTRDSRNNYWNPKSPPHRYLGNYYTPNIEKAVTHIKNPLRVYPEIRRTDGTVELPPSHRLAKVYYTTDGTEPEAVWDGY